MRACIGQLAMEPEGDRVQGCLVAASSAYGRDGSASQVRRGVRGVGECVRISTRIKPRWPLCIAGRSAEFVLRKYSCSCGWAYVRRRNHSCPLSSSSSYHLLLSFESSERGVSEERGARAGHGSNMHAHTTDQKNQNELIILSKNSEYISILSKKSECMPIMTNNSVTDIIHTKLGINLNIHAEEFHFI